MVKRFSSSFYTLIITALLILPTLTAFAQEYIQNDDITVVLEKNGDIQVIEKITVNIKHNRIKQGISQTLPIRTGIHEDYIQKNTFEIQSVQLDGISIPYTYKEHYFNADLMIGDSTAIAPLGKHTYTITYRGQGFVHYGENHDSIQFNAISPQNIFPIEKCSFKLILPNDATPLSVTVWTKESKDETNYKLTGPASLQTLKTLPPQTAFTIAINFPKGLVDSPQQTITDWLNHHRTIALLGLLSSLCLYFLGCWYFLYRKPQQPIRPCDTPPENLTPGLVAWMQKKQFTATMLQADLLWLSINGYMTINLRDSNCLSFTQQSHKKPPISWIARIGACLCHQFYKTDPALLIGKDGRHPSSSLVNAWHVTKNYYKQTVTALTYTSLLPGLIGIGLGIYGLYWLLGYIYHPGLTNHSTPFNIIALPSFFFGISIWIACRCLVGKIIKKIVFSIVALLSFIVGALLLNFDGLFITVIFSIGLISTLFIARFSTQLTDEGQKIAHQIEGLKAYMMQDRLVPAQDTLEQFEKLLPYAVALGCQDFWRQRFLPILQKTNILPQWITLPEPSLIPSTTQIYDKLFETFHPHHEGLKTIQTIINNKS